MQLFGFSFSNFFHYFVLTSLSPQADLHLQVGTILSERIIEIYKESWLCSFKCSVIQLYRLESPLGWNVCKCTICAVYVQWHTDSILHFCMHVLTYVQVQQINSHSLDFSFSFAFFYTFSLNNWRILYPRAAL